jgi:hypothetical protein
MAKLSRETQVYTLKDITLEFILDRLCEETMFCGAVARMENWKVKKVSHIVLKHLGIEAKDITPEGLFYCSNENGIIISNQISVLMRNGGLDDEIYEEIQKLPKV